MTVDRKRIRARMAAALDDVDAIERRPIEEVRAALYDLGIDPTASVGLAQKLTQGRATGDPSARLMQHIERSEALDAEIAALEEADIDDIKAALPRQHAGGAPEAEMTPIEAGARHSDPSGPRRRRSEPQRSRLAMLGWGGSLVGIAASVLLFVALRPDRLQQAESPSAAIEAKAPLALDTERADAVTADVVQRSEERAQALSSEILGSRKGRSHDKSRLAASEAGSTDIAPEVLIEEAEALPAARPLENTARPLGQNLMPAPVKATTEPPRNPPRPVALPNVEEHRAAEVTVLRPGKASALATRAEAPLLRGRGAEVDGLSLIFGDLRAVLLIDEARAPANLVTLAKRLPEGRLATKVGEAEQLVSGGEVVALVAFARDGELVEAALVETSIALPPAQTFGGATGFVDGYAPAPVSTGSKASLELIELSAGD